MLVAICNLFRSLTIQMKAVQRVSFTLFTITFSFKMQILNLVLQITVNIELLKRTFDSMFLHINPLTGNTA